MFPPRPMQLNPIFPKPAALLAAGEVFGPPPGPASQISTPLSAFDVGSTDGALGYGDMPFGDESEPVQVGAGGEDARLVGFVIRMTEFNWFGQRTQTWGGSTIVGAGFKEARDFIEGACSQVLRIEETTLPSGQLMYKFWNSAYEVAQQQAGDPDGYGD